jgi:SAM-dependent methyltransferase
MRREKLFTGLGDLKYLTAVEIGALDKPLLTRDEIQVTYVDYADTQTLRKNYESFPDHDADKIVEVDAVWGDKTLSEALGEGVQKDFVVASHVIEHVPDVITWLQEIGSILKPDGTVRLAIPDRRYCFDIRRRDSTVAEVIYSHMMRARKPLPHQILDFGLNFHAVDCMEVWNGTAEIPEIIDSERVEHEMLVAQSVMQSGEYLDIHCWVFTPLTFARLMQQLSAAGLVNFACKHWFDTARYELEFFIVMEKSEDRTANIASWKEMAESLS